MAHQHKTNPNSFLKNMLAKQKPDAVVVAVVMLTATVL